MWDLITAALSQYGNQLMANPMVAAGKGLWDNFGPKDPSIDPYKPEQPIVYADDGTLKPPAPNPYADLLSAASQPSQQQQQVKPPRMAQMPYLPPSQITPNLGMSQMPNMPLYRQAYGRYF